MSNDRKRVQAVFSQDSRPHYSRPPHRSASPTKFKLTPGNQLTRSSNSTNFTPNRTSPNRSVRNPESQEKKGLPPTPEKGTAPPSGRNAIAATPGGIRRLRCRRRSSGHNLIYTGGDVRIPVELASLVAETFPNV